MCPSKRLSGTSSSERHLRFVQCLFTSSRPRTHHSVLKNKKSKHSSHILLDIYMYILVINSEPVSHVCAYSFLFVCMSVVRSTTHLYVFLNIGTLYPCVDELFVRCPLRPASLLCYAVLFCYLNVNIDLAQGKLCSRHRGSALRPAASWKFAVKF